MHNFPKMVHLVVQTMMVGTALSYMQSGQGLEEQDLEFLGHATAEYTK